MVTSFLQKDYRKKAMLLYHRCVSEVSLNDVYDHVQTCTCLHTTGTCLSSEMYPELFPSQRDSAAMRVSSESSSSVLYPRRLTNPSKSRGFGAWEHFKNV